MKRFSTSLTRGVLAGLAVIGLGAAAMADEPATTSDVLPRAVAIGGDGYYGGGYYGGFASTYQEGVLRGQAAFLRARGEQALNTAEALRSFEAAVDQNLDNDVKRLATRQEREIMGRTHRAAIQRMKLSQRAEARALRLESQVELSPAEQAEKAERMAAGKLQLARNLEAQGHATKAQEWLDEIVRDYPGTQAAREVGMILAGN